jgi:hypothetical protein
MTVTREQVRPLVEIVPPLVQGCAIAPERTTDPVVATR